MNSRPAWEVYIARDSSSERGREGKKEGGQKDNGLYDTKAEGGII